MRAAAKLLLREEKVPLISGTSGFYVAQTIDELVEYQENLRSRIAGIQKDLNAVWDVRDELSKRPKDLFGEEIS